MNPEQHDSLEPARLAMTRGEPVLVAADDIDRGVMVIAARKVSAENVNTLVTLAKGVLSVTLTGDDCQRLGLKFMTGQPRLHGDNFTVSIEAAEGVTTGISAADRARTIAVAVDADTQAADLVQPGHVFPIVPQPGGCLQRATLPEAARDLAAATGLGPYAVISDVLGADGELASVAELRELADTTGMPVVTVADMIRYRLGHEATIERVHDGDVETDFGPFRMVAYRSRVAPVVHMAMIKGEIAHEQPTLVRVHVLNPLWDVAAVRNSVPERSLRVVLERVANEQGVVVILGGQLSAEEVINEIGRLGGSPAPVQPAPLDREVADVQTVGVGGQILADLGVGKMRLIGSVRRYHAMSAFGLEIVEYV